MSHMMATAVGSSDGMYMLCILSPLAQEPLSLAATHHVLHGQP